MGNKTIYLETGDIAKCCSCGNCVRACPQGALKMEENDEGFFYPVVDAEKCIGCGLCAKVCAYNITADRHEPIEVYAVQNKNEDVLKRSSSGGVFFAVAKWAIDQGGVVFGCVFDSEMIPRIVQADTLEACVPMQGSKYVEADLGDSFERVNSLLEKGRLVLYTGTPCMIASLKAYLRDIDTSQLYTIEFLCHGVPSRKIFRANVRDIERKARRKIARYSFRDKTVGWGQCTKVTFVNGKEKVCNSDNQPYHYGYLHGLMNRSSCYDCKFVGSSRGADLTMGDYWDAPKNINEKFNRFLGVSCLIVSTEKGLRIIDKLQESLHFEKTELADIAKGNGAIVGGKTNKSIPQARKEIYREMEHYGFAYVAKKWMRPRFTLKSFAKKVLPNSLIGLIRGKKG